MQNAPCRATDGGVPCRVRRVAADGQAAQQIRLLKQLTSVSRSPFRWAGRPRRHPAAGTRSSWCTAGLAGWFGCVMAVWAGRLDPSYATASAGCRCNRGVRRAGAGPAGAAGRFAHAARSRRPRSRGQPDRLLAAPRRLSVAPSSLARRSKGTRPLPRCRPATPRALVIATRAFPDVPYPRAPGLRAIGSGGIPHLATCALVDAVPLGRARLSRRSDGAAQNRALPARLKCKRNTGYIPY